MYLLSCSMGFFSSSFLHILSMDTDYSLYVYIIVVCTPMHAGLAATNILLILCSQRTERNNSLMCIPDGFYSFGCTLMPVCSGELYFYIVLFNSLAQSVAHNLILLVQHNHLHQ